MNHFFRTFFRFRVRSRRTRALLAAVLLCAVFVSGVLYYLAKQGGEEYVTYAALAQAHSDAAYLAGAQNNPIRQELNRELALSLSPSASNAERLTHAQGGLQLLVLAEQQIDEIGTVGAKVDTLVAKMQVEALSGFVHGGMTWELITLAKRRSAIIADIRGLSYRANFEAKQILEQIVKDGGVLTPAHTTRLNAAIPEMEEQFDRRSNLYRELESVSAQMEEKSAAQAWF